MNTKINMLILFWLFVPTILLSARTNGSKIERMDIAPFRKLVVIGNENTNVALYPNDVYGVTIETSVSNKLKIENTDSVLLICDQRDSENADTPININVYAPVFNEIFCPRVGRLSCAKKLRTDSLRVTVSGTEIFLDAEAQHMQLKYDNCTTAVILGECNVAYIDYRGRSSKNNTSSLHAEEFCVKKMNLRSGALSDIFINVTDSLWLVGGVMTNIEVIGTPSIIENKLVHYKLMMTDIK